MRRARCEKKGQKNPISTPCQNRACAAGHALLGSLRIAGRFVFLLKAAAAVIRFLNRAGIHRRHIPSRDLRALDERMHEELLSEGKSRK